MEKNYMKKTLLALALLFSTAAYAVDPPVLWRNTSTATRGWYTAGATRANGSDGPQGFKSPVWIGTAPTGTALDAWFYFTGQPSGFEYGIFSGSTLPNSLAGSLWVAPGATPTDFAYAGGTLTFTGVVADGQTVTIGDRVYEFDTDSDTTTGNVAVDVSGGATASAAVTALVSAITGDASAVVTASDGAGDTVVLVAKSRIAAIANALATTETCTNGSFGAATLTGGVTGVGNATLAGDLTVGDDATVTDQLTTAKLTTNGVVILVTGAVPSAATDACTAGTVAIDTTHIYVCTASGAWKRVAIATFP